MCVLSLKTAKCYKKILKKYSVLDSIFNHYMHSLYIVYPDFHSQYRDVMKKYNNYRSREKRKNKYIQNMLDNASSKYESMYLVSLTFTDDVLASTKSQVRRKYIARYLDSISTDYYACIDFGKKNGREHYHAIISTSCLFTPFIIRNKVFYKPFDHDMVYPYGFSSFRRIDDAFKSSRYAFKASRYAFKSSDGCNVRPFHKRSVCQWSGVDDLIAEMF